MTTGSIRRAGGTQRIPAPHSRHDAGKPLWDNRSVEFSLDSLISTVADRAEPLGAISSPRPDERISSVLALLAPGPNGAEVLLTVAHVQYGIARYVVLGRKFFFALFVSLTDCRTSSLSGQYPRELN